MQKPQKPHWYGDVSPANSALHTPMMKQFVKLKSKVPDALLLYRMGDFYELFLEDARIAGDLLDLNVTSRNKKSKEPIPMAGIPYHALENYLSRLATMGRKVAIAEQREDPNNKKMMTRELTRVVTPGIPWNSDGIESRESCWLAAICGHGPVGVAFLDVSTSDFKVTEFSSIAAALSEIRRMQAKEIIVDSRLMKIETVAQTVENYPFHVEDSSYFDSRHAKVQLCKQFQVADLGGFGAARLRSGIGAAGALLSYARDTALIDVSHVTALQTYSLSGQMVLDEATVKNLEIINPLHGTDRSHTLLSLMDKTKTAMGGRLLRQWLSAPLLDLKRIQRRQDAISSLLESSIRDEVRNNLREVADIERLAAKLAQEKMNPREMLSLSHSIYALPKVFAPLSKLKPFQGFIPKELPSALADQVFEYIVDDPPVTISDGGIIRKGVNKELDEYTSLAVEGKTAVAKMEDKEKKKTGITSLKIKYNRVFGYFLEVTTANIEKVPSTWIRKQTLTNAERYITPELKEFEEKILSASEKKKALEHEIYIDLRKKLAKYLRELQSLAKRIAHIDVLSSLSELAICNRYCRPSVNDSNELVIKSARHPVIEMMDMEEPFVPNDIKLNDDNRLMILTGPNMAGKSTIMRQVALIALMAQVGSFVPAESATLGLCDRIFVRVGASDDLARGRSTFMVEMAETALILNQASSRSLLFLDEIGRGTSTFDGLSIAWAVAEAVHDKLEARTIFATHYHELTALAEKKKYMINMHVSIAEAQGKIVFLRTLVQGGVGRSYGIQCAKLAGMPRSVINRAKEVLHDLESRSADLKQIDQLNLFSQPPKIVEEIPPHLEQVEEIILKINPDDTTPRQALELIYQLKGLFPVNSR